MKLLGFAVLALAVAGLVAGRGLRIPRGMNNSQYGLSSYGRGSDERDASVSQESSGCGGGIRSYGNSNSGSREYAYNKDGRDSNSREHNIRGGRTYARATASAVATSRHKLVNFQTKL